MRTSKLAGLVVVFLLLCWVIPVFAESVDTVWVRRYNGPANSADLARVMAVNDSGNVYVTGYSMGSGTNYDYATVKYYSNGDTAWVRRYTGPGSYQDYAYAIVVDNSGNVYVTGSSKLSTNNDDYATIKYYPNGDTAWIRRYNGLSNGNDAARSAAVDDSGNIYVTGSSYSDTTGSDCVTIKYKPNGDTAWLRRYNGNGNSYGGDGGRVIAVDTYGNIYVTGYSYSGTNDDYATIKYYPNGDTAWVRRYNGLANSDDEPNDLVIDDSGNVYVTGISKGSGTLYDYATIKYYPNGDTAWARRYNGPGNYWDNANAIVVDNSGNVYVTGSSPQSSVSPNNTDCATIKYYPNGDTAWIRRYNGLANLDDAAYDLAVDDFGKVYVTGTSQDTLTRDYLTIKYDSSGRILWVEKYDASNGNGNDAASAIALDDSGNIYLTGYSRNSEANDDYTTIKYIQFLFLRGDCDKNGNINLVDVIILANYVLKGGPAPNPLQSGDVNCDGKYNLADVIQLARYVLFGQPLPC